VQTISHHRLLTVQETAERLAVHEDTVRRRIARGEIPAVQLGGRGSSLRIDERELEAWLYGRPNLTSLSLAGGRGARGESAAATAVGSPAQQGDA
jgi:excisionase family DNA binding protein